MKNKKIIQKLLAKRGIEAKDERVFIVQQLLEGRAEKKTLVKSLTEKFKLLNATTAPRVLAYLNGKELIEARTIGNVQYYELSKGVDKEYRLLCMTDKEFIDDQFKKLEEKSKELVDEIGAKGEDLLENLGDKFIGFGKWIKKEKKQESEKEEDK